MRYKMKLLNIDDNAKTVKGQKLYYMTGILYLAPAKLSGFEVCPMATAGCRAACLNTAGRGRFDNIQKARIERTRRFFLYRRAFMNQLCREIDNLIFRAVKKDMLPCVRLNGTSDIVWENVRDWNDEGKNLMEIYPGLNFYDYTKRSNRKNLPANYSLVFSLGEDNDLMAKTALSNGANVAVVFRTSKHPKEYLGVPVIDGDENDLRFLDPQNVVVGLYAKGQAKKDTSGFVREVN